MKSELESAEAALGKDEKGFDELIRKIEPLERKVLEARNAAFFVAFIEKVL